MTSLSTLAIFCIDRCFLLAGQAQYIQMGRRFRRGGGGVAWTDLLIPIAVIGVVAAIAWLVTRYVKYREQRKADSPHELFAELCRAHGLDRASQRLLRRLAKAHRLQSPAQLFVEPARFDLEILGKAFEARRAQTAALRSKLFAASGGEAADAS
ncbi:MAG TPA: hypothetical protein VMM76_00270 [Pirellulaceae bacterium]|nr:hypothetical protein [Pirellulaceae bacterium]